jgi:flavin reductase (DIM6/NTAB) family NADH-FMN oxidoreductase RutF
MNETFGSPRVAVVGAGQAGTQLALGLQHHGYRVTLVTDRSADQIRGGSIMSSQCMFEPALDVEDNSDVPTFSGQAPPIYGVEFTVVGKREVKWAGTFDGPAMSVDLRLKCATWIDMFEQRGGTVRIEAATLRTLEDLAAEHELVVVSTGKGELGEIFTVDSQRSPYDRPQRSFAMMYVQGVTAGPQPSIRMAVAPGIGEFFTLPTLTGHGTCDIIMFEAVPDGPMDIWADIDGAEAQFAASLRILQEYFPDEAARFAGATALGESEALRGKVTPVVRHPVGTLPSGRTVLGLGRAVVVTDPLTSQPTNNAALAADFYLDAILRRNRRSFDDDWKSRTFEAFWLGWASWSVGWTNSMLDGLGDPQLALMEQAPTLPGVATALAHCFEDPRTSYRWWFEDEEAEKLIERARLEAAAIFDIRDLRAVLGNFATGVTVVTTTGPNDQPVGVTANSFSSVSLVPPLVLWCPAKSSRSLAAFAVTAHFAINVLGSGQHHLSRQFATSVDDKFKGVEYSRGIAGVPLLTGSIATFECRTVSRYDAGDHFIYVGQVERYQADQGEPLLFHRGKYHATRPHPDLT